MSISPIPAGVDWWRNGLKTTLLDYGVTSAWNDNNEFEIWDEDAQCNGAGRPFSQALARPAQAMLMSKIAQRNAKRTGSGRSVLTSSAAPAGRESAATRKPGRATISPLGKRCAGICGRASACAVSGLFNIGHDVGGFHGPTPDPELFCRFVEFCALWPRFVMNSWKDNGTVNLPWMYPDILPAVREAYGLRYRLMPHIYAAMRLGAAEHVPPVRPLEMDFPDDPDAASEQDAFLLGNGLLVAPVLDQGATKRTVYLPVHAAGWYDFHSGHCYAGGETATVMRRWAAYPCSQEAAP